MRKLISIVAVLGLIDSSFANFGRDTTYHGNPPKILMLQAYEITRSILEESLGVKVAREYKCTQIIGMLERNSHTKYGWHSLFFITGHDDIRIVIPFSTTEPYVESRITSRYSDTAEVYYTMETDFIEAYQKAKDMIPEEFSNFYCISGSPTHIGGFFRFHHVDRHDEEIHIHRDGKIVFVSPESGLKVLSKSVEGRRVW